jgi:hypothetical protein
VDPGAAEVAAATRPGDNANAAAYRQLATGAAIAGDGLGGRTARERAEHLQAVVGDTMAEGRAWVA